MNEFNSHLETLSEHHDIPKVRWHGAVQLEAVPDESARRLVLAKMRSRKRQGCGLCAVGWPVGYLGKPGMVYSLQISIVIYLFDHEKIVTL